MPNASFKQAAGDRAAVVQGHVVAEQQVRLLPQHYLDQLPQAAEPQHDWPDEEGALTADWQQQDGRDSVTIQGEEGARDAQPQGGC